jgi:hypothetical protein
MLKKIFVLLNSVQWVQPRWRGGDYQDAAPPPESKFTDFVDTMISNFDFRVPQ